MSLSDQHHIDTASIAKAFVNARREHLGLNEYPGVIPNTLEQAYQIQSHAIGLWKDKIAGWKVGGVPAALQEKFNAERLVGPIFEKSIKHCGDGGHTAMPIFADGFAAIEAEFIIQLGDVEHLPADNIGLEQLKDAITQVYIGVEIASSPLTIINDIGPVGPVSDFGNNAGLIVGPEVKDWRERDLSFYPANVNINDEDMGTKAAPPAEAGPLGATKFLVEHLKQSGREIPAGTLVSTGAITGVHRAYVDAKSKVVFEGLGEISLELVSGKA